MTTAAVVLPRLDWRESPNQSSRHGAAVSLVVVHRPVGSYASAVSWLSDPRASASAHIVMAPGGEEATQLVSWDKKAWACVHFNALSDNLEIADEAWTGDDPKGLAVAARIVAFRLHKRGLPAYWVRGHELDTGRGFTRHLDLGQAGGGHTDPTTSLAIWLDFCARVKHELARGRFRKAWGR